MWLDDHKVHGSNPIAASSDFLFIVNCFSILNDQVAQSKSLQDQKNSLCTLAHSSFSLSLQITTTTIHTHTLPFSQYTPSNPPFVGAHSSVGLDVARWPQGPWFKSHCCLKLFSPHCQLLFSIEWWSSSFLKPPSNQKHREYTSTVFFLSLSPLLSLYK